jgi:solute carrier family 27 fatty acid transporter 1/4
MTIKVFIICIPSEPGILVGLISSSNVIQEFHGYIDKEALSRKILHNVFKRGERAFITGEYKITTLSKMVSH